MAEDYKAQFTVRELGIADYEPVWQAMKTYTDTRDKQSADELWFVEHPPVFTQGQAGKAEHVLAPGDIPVVKVDRGGQVTYHGPGQLVAYVMFDLKRMKLGVRDLVHGTEECIINVLAKWGVEAIADPEAPGVYVEGKKIASVGMRVRKGCSFHGLGLNLSADLSPFLRINPCGYAGMEITRLSDLSGYTSEQINLVKQQLAEAYSERFNMSNTGQVEGLPVLETVAK